MNLSTVSELPLERSQPRTKQSLLGCIIAVTAERRAGELAAALQRRGAVIRHAPALSMIPHVDDAELIARTRDVIAHPPQVVVVTTGIGMRGWVEAADMAGLAEDLLAVLRRCRLVARGPKARGALQANGLTPDWVAESETSAEIIDTMLSEGVDGLSVAVQHHGAGDDGLHRALSGAGATVRDLVVYRWGPPPVPEAVSASARWAAAGEVDAVVYTSAPAAASWLASVREQGLLGRIIAHAEAGTVMHACVGSVTSAPLDEAGIPTIQPERARMGALVRRIIAHYEDETGLPTPAGPLIMRSGGAVLGDRLVSLSPGPHAVLRALASAGGGVVTREHLLGVLPGGSRDAHAVEVAIARLRDALGTPSIITTVPRRGYRIA